MGNLCIIHTPWEYIYIVVIKNMHWYIGICCWSKLWVFKCSKLSDLRYVLHNQGNRRLDFSYSKIRSHYLFKLFRCPVSRNGRGPNTQRFNWATEQDLNYCGALCSWRSWGGFSNLKTSRVHVQMYFNNEIHLSWGVLIISGCPSIFPEWYVHVYWNLDWTEIHIYN